MTSTASTQGAPAIEAIDAAYDRLYSILRAQYRRTLAVVGLVGAAFLVAAGMLLIRDRPADLGPQLDSAVSLTEDLGAALNDLALNLRTPENAAEVDKLLIETGRASEAHRLALDQVESASSERPPQALTIAQLVGGSAVVVLFGFLGLQRLQNIDVEIQGLRSFMFEQLRERVGEVESNLGSQIGDRVASALQQREVQLEELADSFTAVVGERSTEFNLSANAASEQIVELEDRLSALLRQYEWLDNPNDREAADRLNDLQSVEDAQRTAETFRMAGDVKSARLALEQIVSRDLRGSYDDFHNALTEALRLHIPQLALEIADAGLASFVDNPDLVADRAKALVDVGRPLEALEFLDSFRSRRPRDFARTWRPAVFYADSVAATLLDGGQVARLTEMFEEVLAYNSQHGKVWSRYSRILMEAGRFDEADEVLVRGLSSLPLSQELRVVRGQLLLDRGKASDALAELEAAIRVDYQEQFQSDVSQPGVWGLLAQAYEANGRTVEARAWYEAVLGGSSGHTFFTQYARDRLNAIRVGSGEEVLDLTESSASKELLAALLNNIGGTPKA